MFAKLDGEKRGDEGTKELLISLVHDASANHPRSRQKAIGPSEIGEPCARKLGYKFLEVPKTNDSTDPWASFVGTAVHAKLEEVVVGWGERNQSERFLVEQIVYLPGTSIKGSCDLFDTETGTVIDYKIIGVGPMREYKRNIPEYYRVQVQLYGLGLESAGHKVENVAIAFFPRSGFLTDLFVHTEKYDPEIARAALARLGKVESAAEILGDASKLPAQPSRRCTFCPFYDPTVTEATAKSCPGELQNL